MGELILFVGFIITAIVFLSTMRKIDIKHEKDIYELFIEHEKKRKELIKKYLNQK